MKNKLILIISIIIYYGLMVYFALFQPFCLQLYSFSDLLNILILIIFISFMGLPLFLCKKFNIDDFKSILISLGITIIYYLVLLIIGYILSNYFKDFSHSKWTNPKYCDIRYQMVESLEKKHKLVGMKKEEIYKLLGNTKKNTCEYDYEENNKICYSTYDDNYMSNDFYCLYIGDDGTIIKTEVVKVR